MKKSVLVLVFWVYWWMGQCLCNQDPHLTHETNRSPYSGQPSRGGTQIPSSQPNTTSHVPPPINNSSVRRRGSLPTTNSLHPVPGVTQDTHSNRNNTSHPVPTRTKTDKTSNGPSRHNPRRHTISPSMPPATTSTPDPRHSAGKEFSTVNYSTTDKGYQEAPTRGPSPEHKFHGGSLPSSRPAHDHDLDDMSGNRTTPQTFTAEGRNEGGGRESHGRITTGKNLCSYSFCLCNVGKTNVICKHEHTNHDNVHQLTLSQLVIPPSTRTLEIVGFEKVVILNNTFAQENLELRRIYFENIEHVQLQSKSLYFSPKAKMNMEVTVIFKNCKIPNMPQETFTQLARSEDARQDNNLEKTRYLTLMIEGCNITSMRSYALYKARLYTFHMTRTKVEVMEENSIYLDIYIGWKIEKSQLPDLIEKSISLRAQDIVEFSHNTILGLGNRSLDIISSNRVLFEFNNITHLRSEALLGIRPHKEARGASIVFLNNTITKADERSLLTSKQYSKHEREIIGNKLNIPCTCNAMTTFKKLLGIDNTSNYDDLAMFKTVTRKSFCQVLPNVRSYTRVKEYYDQKCTLPITEIVASTTVGVVLLVLIVVWVVCSRRVKKAREEANYIGECTISQSFSTLHSNPQLPLSIMPGQPNQPWESTGAMQPWVVAVPEVKTYKETELNVAFEHTEPMNVSLRDNFHPEPGPLLDHKRRTQIRSSCPFN